MESEALAFYAAPLSVAMEGRMFSDIEPREFKLALSWEGAFRV
jgi:hypothetical protein